jgi:hypothetical protein
VQEEQVKVLFKGRMVRLALTEKEVSELTSNGRNGFIQDSHGTYYKAILPYSKDDIDGWTATFIQIDANEEFTIA